MGEKISGYIHRFDDGREVFVGQRDGNDGSYFIRFKNAEGEETKFGLSAEAFDSLIGLRKICDRKGEPAWVFKQSDEPANPELAMAT